MAGTSYVAFNPNDPVQTGFLSALALGETGNSSYASTEGYGGVNLEGAPVDNQGFPLQPGGNVSSAAGSYQFVKGTYDALATELGLDTSFSQSDQNEAAWQLAQQTYTAKTGGNLYQALSSGDYTSVQNALANIWPSVSGNAAAPGGLAASLAGGRGANIPFPALPPRRVAIQAALVALMEARRAYLEILRTGSKDLA
jgi:hypothetical protein